MLQNKEATFAPPIVQGGVNELETNRDLYEQHDMEACVWLFSNRKRGLRSFFQFPPEHHHNRPFPHRYTHYDAAKNKMRTLQLICEHHNCLLLKYYYKQHRVHFIPY